MLGYGNRDAVSMCDCGTAGIGYRWSGQERLWRQFGRWWREDKKMPRQVTNSYLADSLDVFRNYKKLAEKAMAQITDEQLGAVLDSEMNSIAVIVKHMAGNMRSRWTDFLNSDGEKPGRNRDGEFVDAPTTREALLEIWEEGWQSLFSALEPLAEEDLTRTITIRGEAHSVMQAINRQIAHYAYHCGQIILLAKHFKSDGWKSLSIPRGQSGAFRLS
jgi:uncharacterized damage-inducible protein DinB